jgi:hypothetical protein
MCSREFITANTMSSSSRTRGEDSLVIEEVAGLRQENAEVDRFRQENAEVDRLRQENGKLQERNFQLAAELACLDKAVGGGSSREYHTAEDKTGYSDVSDVHVVVPVHSFPAIAASLDDIDSDNNTDVEENEHQPKKKNYETEYVIQKLDKGGTPLSK